MVTALPPPVPPPQRGAAARGRAHPHFARGNAVSRVAAGDRRQRERRAAAVVEEIQHVAHREVGDPVRAQRRADVEGKHVVAGTPGERVVARTPLQVEVIPRAAIDDIVTVVGDDLVAAGRSRQRVGQAAAGDDHVFHAHQRVGAASAVGQRHGGGRADRARVEAGPLRER
jgi:hypothetical protein